jgi:hypothetical protein
MFTLLGGIFVDKIYHAPGKNTKTINPSSLARSQKAGIGYGLVLRLRYWF